MTTFLDKLQPMPSDLKTLTLPGGPDLNAAEREMDAGAHLDGCKKHVVRNIRREQKDLRQKAAALKHLAGLPAEGELWECWIDGSFPLWALIPAIIDLVAPATITELHCATLSFSQGNVASMLELLDAGKIGRMTLLASHYFACTSAETYSGAAIELASRGHKCSSSRNHAKVMAIAISDGRRFTIKSSANFRSCGNTEEFDLMHDAGSYEFHRGIIEELAQ